MIQECTKYSSQTITSYKNFYWYKLDQTNSLTFTTVVAIINEYSHKYIYKFNLCNNHKKQEFTYKKYIYFSIQSIFPAAVTILSQVWTQN